MKDVIKYKDYYGTVRFSSDDRIFFGKIEGIEDLVTFEGHSVDELVQAFEEAVDDYIELCNKNEKSAGKSYKGSFNVRIDPDLHKKAARYSSSKGVSLNHIVEEAIEKYLDRFEG